MTPTSRLTWEELRGRFHYSNLCNYYFTIEFYWFLWVFKWCFCDFLAIWTLSSTRRPCGTMRKFIRQKKHQVRGHFVPSINCSIYYLFFHLIVWQSRAQAFVEDSTAGVEEEQEERLLQSARCCQECHGGWDQKGLSQKSSDAPPRSVFAEQNFFIFFLNLYYFGGFVQMSFLLALSDRSPQLCYCRGAKGGGKEVQGGGRGLHCTLWPKEEDPLWQWTRPGWWWWL